MVWSLLDETKSIDASRNLQSKRETQLQVVSSHSKVREQNKNTHIGKIHIYFNHDQSNLNDFNLPCFYINFQAKAIPKRIEVVRLAPKSNKDSVEDQQGEVENGITYLLKSTGHGSLESILTTKCIHHKSSPASYFARACVGFILLITFARQALL